MCHRQDGATDETVLPTVRPNPNTVTPVYIVRKEMIGTIEMKEHQPHRQKCSGNEADNSGLRISRLAVPR
jgi:hypothetical protein